MPRRSHPSLPRPRRVPAGAPRTGPTPPPPVRVPAPDASARPATVRLAEAARLEHDGASYTGPAARYVLLWQTLPPAARAELARLAGSDTPAGARRAEARLRALLRGQP